jgi:hypothetical protein
MAAGSLLRLRLPHASHSKMHPLGFEWDSSGFEEEYQRADRTYLPVRRWGRFIIFLDMRGISNVLALVQAGGEQNSRYHATRGSRGWPSSPWSLRFLTVSFAQVLSRRQMRWETVHPMIERPGRQCRCCPLLYLPNGAWSFLFLSGPSLPARSETFYPERDSTITARIGVV